MSVDKIIEQIWIGDKDIAKSLSFIKDNNISVIINCTKNIDNYYENNPELEYYRVNVNDRLKDIDVIEMGEIIYDVINYIYRKYNEGHNILVHCKKGKQRSATVVTGVLSLLYPKKNIYELLEMVIAKRSVVFNNGKQVNFIDVLMNII